MSHWLSGAGLMTLADRIWPAGRRSETSALDHSSLPDAAPVPTLRLTGCRKPKSDKNVKWNEGTVDNENLNKKKSKCCCIYKKKKEQFDESSDSESDECENCFGHVEVKKQKKELNTTTEASSTTCCQQTSTTQSNGSQDGDHIQPVPSDVPATSS